MEDLLILQLIFEALWFTFTSPMPPGGRPACEHRWDLDCPLANFSLPKRAHDALTLNLRGTASDLRLKSLDSLEAVMNSFCGILGNPDRGIAPFLPGFLVSNFDYSRLVGKEAPGGLLTESPKS